MLEDMSEEGWTRWRDGMSALAQQSNMNVKLSGPGTFVHACRADAIGPIIEATVQTLEPTVASAAAIFRSRSFGLTTLPFTEHSGIR
jgi:hypothetical protein